jgi:flagellar biosynthetic protein FliR
MISNLIDYSSHVQPFLMVFLRIGAMLMAIPVFSGQNVPALLKIGFSLSVCVILYPHLNLPLAETEPEFVPFCIGIAGEIFIGLIMGLTVQLAFCGIQLAGQLVGFQMGFAIANVMDPSGGDQIPILSQLVNLVAILVFFTINAHHWMLRATVESFHLMPPMNFYYHTPIFDYLMHSAANMFVIAIKIGAPVIVVLILTSVSMGILARTVPQMHIFIVAMPVKIAIGLIFLMLSLPYMVSLLGQIFDGVANSVMHILTIGSGIK